MWCVDVDLFGGYFGCLVCELPMIVALDSVCLCLLPVVYFVFRVYGCLPLDFCCLCFACLCGFWCWLSVAIASWFGCVGCCSGFCYGIVLIVCGFNW